VLEVSSTGTWTGDVNEYTYAWLRDGVEIEDAEAASYTVTVDDIGATLKARVTATNDDGSTSADSVATAEVGDLADPFYKASRRPIVEAWIAALEAGIGDAGGGGGAVLEYEIDVNGSRRRMRFADETEARAKLNNLRAELRMIIGKQRTGAGLGDPRHVLVRFGRA
jgi:hypothetical protein